jgi:hypothetical protein
MVQTADRHFDFINQFPRLTSSKEKPMATISTSQEAAQIRLLGNSVLRTGER